MKTGVQETKTIQAGERTQSTVEQIRNVNRNGHYVPPTEEKIAHTSDVKEFRSARESALECLSDSPKFSDQYQRAARLGEAYENSQPLIAAAPELLEALKKILFNAEHGNGLQTQLDTRNQARAAIAKAEGRAQ